MLHQNGGGGDDRRWDGDMWVYPLPPDGPVTFVASWPKHGVTETRAELDGAAIRAAAGRAVILWPEELETEPDGTYSWRSHAMTSESASARAEPGEPGVEDESGDLD